MLSADRVLLSAAQDRLEARYGSADVLSEIFPFDFTHYYDEEMGDGLLRRFVSFERRIDPGALADIKRTTNELEAQFAQEASSPARPINLDPGYLAPSKLILASMKDFSHRIYLRAGVYAEVTLLYRDGWQALPWTFPDYASGRYDEFLTAARESLRRQQKQEVPT